MPVLIKKRQNCNVLNIKQLFYIYGYKVRDRIIRLSSKIRKVRQNDRESVRAQNKQINIPK